MIKSKEKRFTLIELIIVIVVIGILAGMALPKFTGVVRNSKVAAMVTDIDTLEKAIELYYQDNDNLPIEEENISTFSISSLSDSDMSEIYTSLQETLKLSEDSEEYLYKINLDESGKYHSKTKYGHGKTDKDFYVYSTKSNRVYYYGYLKDSDNNYNHTNIPITLESNELVKKIPSNSLDDNTENNNGNTSSKYKWNYIDSGDYDAKNPKINESTWGDIQNEEVVLSSNVNNNALFDKDPNTVHRGGATITWNKDIAGKTLEIDIAEHKITFSDENGKTLPYIDAETGKEISTYNWIKTKKKVIVPNNAVKLELSNYSIDSHIRDISLVEGDNVGLLQNISIENENHKQKLSWEQSENVSIVSIYYDNSYVGTSTNGYFEYTPNSNNMSKDFKLIPITNNNLTNKIYSFNSITPKVMFSSNKSTDAALFDKNNSTTLNNAAKITWNKDITGKTLRVNVDYHQLDFKDADGNSLSYIDVNSGKVVNSQWFKGVVDVLVPYNATSLEIRNHDLDIKIKDIEIVEENKTTNINNISIENDIHKQKISWEQPENISKVLVFYDNTYVGTSTNGYFEYTPNSNNMNKEFKLLPINNKNISYMIYDLNSVKPEIQYSSNKTSDAALFDNNSATNIVNNVKITWDGNIEGKKLYVDIAKHSIRFYDENGTKISSTNWLSGIKEIDVPNNATTIEIANYDLNGAIRDAYFK